MMLLSMMSGRGADKKKQKLDDSSSVKAESSNSVALSEFLTSHQNLDQELLFSGNGNENQHQGLTKLVLQKDEDDYEDPIGIDRRKLVLRDCFDIIPTSVTSIKRKRKHKEERDGKLKLLHEPTVHSNDKDISNAITTEASLSGNSVHFAIGDHDQPALPSGTRFKKSSSAASMATMAARLNGMTVPSNNSNGSLELEEDLLLAVTPPSLLKKKSEQDSTDIQQQEQQPLPSSPPSPSSPQSQEQQQQPSSASPPTDSLWIKDQARYWSFIPNSMEEAVSKESSRYSAVVTSLDEVKDTLTTELMELIACSKRTKTDRSPEEATELYSRLKMLEELIDTIIRRIAANTAKLEATGRALHALSENHLVLVEKHRAFARNLICHGSQQSTFNPNKPGSSLLNDPYAYV